MFSEKDFKLDSVGELLELLPIFLFMGLITPFLSAAYTLGFLMKVTGILNK